MQTFVFISHQKCVRCVRLHLFSVLFSACEHLPVAERERERAFRPLCFLVSSCLFFFSPSIHVSFVIIVMFVVRYEFMLIQYYLVGRTEIHWSEHYNGWNISFARTKSPEKFPARSSVKRLNFRIIYPKEVPLKLFSFFFLLKKKKKKKKTDAATQRILFNEKTLQNFFFIAEFLSSCLKRFDRINRICFIACSKRDSGQEKTSI